MELLGLPDVPSVSRLVRQGKLTPTRKLPGLRGPRLFDRDQVMALAGERKAKLEADAASIADAIAAAESRAS